MLIASDWSWVTKIVVAWVRAWIAFSSVRIATRSLASRLERGSSIRKTLGLTAMARATATRCCCPPESWEGYRFRSSAMLVSSATSRTVRSISSLGSLFSFRG